MQIEIDVIHPILFRKVVVPSFDCYQIKIGKYTICYTKDTSIEEVFKSLMEIKVGKNEG